MKAKNLKKIFEEPRVKDNIKQDVTADEFDSVMKTILSAPPIENKKRNPPNKKAGTNPIIIPDN